MHSSNVLDTYQLKYVFFIHANDTPYDKDYQR